MNINEDDLITIMVDLYIILLQNSSTISNQKCIAVGCVPTAAMTAIRWLWSGGDVCLWLGYMCLSGPGEGDGL